MIKTQDLTTERRTFHFVSHTHWDREWYLTFEQFRLRLVQLVDNLLDLLEKDARFAYFHLDGQTIVLEDYLKIRPSKRKRLEALIREGRILVGPWYEQNDLFLTSAESTVRNLLEGIRTSRELGGEMKVGYLPDHFGLVGQMPQIFRGVGIDNSVFGRGYDLAKHGNPYCFWRAPDGSEVVGILMPHWYNNAQRLPNSSEDLKKLFPELRTREELVNTLPHYLMMNGVDHLEAQEDLPEVLDRLRMLFGGECEFVHDTLPNYTQMIARYMCEARTSYPVVEGELREREDYAILGGTLSSRVYLKQANMLCHDLIEKWVEPLSVWCAVYNLEPYDHDLIRHLWKIYMQNHPHDSICGCSQDAVHDHMMDRFASVREIAGEIIERKLELLTRQVDISNYEKEDQKLLVVNTSQQESRSVISSSLYFLAEDTVDTFEVLAPDDVSVPYRITSVAPSRIQVLSPINLPGILEVKRFDIEWQPHVPPMSYAAYRIRAHRQGQVIESTELQEDLILDNEYLRVTVHKDGTFGITDKRTNRTLSHLGQLEDTGDCGDLYVYASVKGEEATLWDGEVKVTEAQSTPLFDRCRYRLTWHLPVELTPDLQARTRTTAPCNVEVTLQLDKGSPYVKFDVAIDNQAKDHRIRVTFPLSDKIEQVVAGGQFDAVQRAWDEGSEYARDCNAQPYWKWVAPRVSGGGLAVYTRGTHEYEVADDGRTLAVTLLRCVETINQRAIPPLESDIQPKGQCQGNHMFEMALRPFADESATQLYQEAEGFHQSVKTKLLPAESAGWRQGRAWVQDAGVSGLFTRADPNATKKRLPMTGTLLTLQGQALVSTLKEAESGSGIVVRVYNIESEPSDVEIGLPVPVRSITPTNLLEEPLPEPKVVNRSLTVTLPPKKFATYLFEVESAES